MEPQAEKKKFIKKLKHKYRLVVFNDEVLGEEMSFTLSPLNVIIAVLSIFLITILSTFFIITYTPLRKYLPGSSYADNQIELENLKSELGSLHDEMASYKTYYDIVQAIANGQVPVLPTDELDTGFAGIPAELTPPSEEDSLLRQTVEELDQYNVNLDRLSGNSLASFSFYPPVQGMISSTFDRQANHLGVDIVAPKGSAIKSTLKGIVVYAEWSVETGYVIAVQHKNDLLSIYKHNSSLLKTQGEIVEAGEPIAIIGNSGELSSGPHLHFELWYENSAVNPEEYVSF